MSTLISLSASDLRRAAAIKDKIEDLQRRLNACLGGAFTGNGYAPKRQSPKAGRKRGKAKGGTTVADCVLQALGEGETVPVGKIIIRASQIRGKAISPMMLRYTLAQMKKAGQIKNPKRGQYRRA